MEPNNQDQNVKAKPEQEELSQDDKSDEEIIRDLVTNIHSLCKRVKRLILFFGSAMMDGQRAWKQDIQSNTQKVAVLDDFKFLLCLND